MALEILHMMISSRERLGPKGHVVWRSRVLILGAGFALFLISVCAKALEATGRLWQIVEIGFALQRPAERPSDVEVSVTFLGPAGASLVLPAFWDGDNIWRVRFTPTLAGLWSYEAKTGSKLGGLVVDTGTVSVFPPESTVFLHQHGGFLRVSGDGRRLMHPDGEPFFWLGDTWWYCPSTLCPIDGSSSPQIASMFKHLVDKRVKQGFTVAQIAFVGPRANGSDLFNPAKWTDADVAAWKDVDAYFRYAADSGLLLAVAIGWHGSFDRMTIAELKQLWRYVVARYGAFPVTWILVGEYNFQKDYRRVRKVLELGDYVKSIDPYRRAMSVHPWQFQGDDRQAWRAPWADFIMIQGGHGAEIPLRVYRDAFAQVPPKPFIESEARYEGILGQTSARQVRNAAIRAFQSGAAGFSYGAHGLWYPTQGPEDQRFFEEWGKASPWWEALNFPGASHMGSIRACYQTARWWTLAPDVDALVIPPSQSDWQNVLIARDDIGGYVAYLPPGHRPDPVVLRDRASDRAYEAWWCDPITGNRQAANINRREGGMSLPPAPTREDWLFFISPKSSSSDRSSGLSVVEPPHRRAAGDVPAR